jgi:hypothetical protein
MGWLSGYFNAINNTMPLYPGSKAIVEAAAASENFVQDYASTNYPGVKMDNFEFFQTVGVGKGDGLSIFMVLGLLFLILIVIFKD